MFKLKSKKEKEKEKEKEGKEVFSFLSFHCPTIDSPHH
jgi:hypothetical protein